MASFRDSDIIGRLTHDTFAVLMAGATMENVDVAGNRVEAATKERNLRGDSEYELDVEIAAVAYDPDIHSDVNALINDAENILEEGRGQDSTNDSDYEHHASFA
jgi:GGDEF domain-containing protein